MSLTKFVSIAGAALIVALGGTFLITQIMVPAKRFEDCVGGGVAGGAIGGPFELIDHRGQMVTDVDVLDQPALVYFGYTFCPDVCPMDVARNVVAVEILADRGLQVKPVFITIDPARDTPDVMADYIGHFHPRMTGLTGSPAQITQVTEAYRIYSRKVDDPGSAARYTMDHSAVVYLMGPDGRFLAHFSPGTSPEAMADKIAGFLGG